ncbi:hypothetical protein Y887_02485 [Xanthomonas pisi DSM 18956]|nr:hypothetical protein Y887_02485 [Xanthomonas pisi DSM 18956]
MLVVAILASVMVIMIDSVLRILRLFRILKLTRYIEESGQLVDALGRSRRKVLMFMLRTSGVLRDSSAKWPAQMQFFR